MELCSFIFVFVSEYYTCINHIILITGLSEKKGYSTELIENQI